MSLKTQSHCLINLFEHIWKQLRIDSFSSIRILNLKNCQLVSIEGVSAIDMPRVSNIRLAGNNIISFKPLAKTNFRQLKKLSNSKNHLINLTPFHRMRMMVCDENTTYQYKNTGMILRQTALQVNSLIQESSGLLKLQINHLYMIQCYATKQIKQNKLISQVKRKYHKQYYQIHGFFL